MASTVSNEFDASSEEPLTDPCLAIAGQVLIAEDDECLRRLIAKVLAFEGYFVTEAADGVSMLEILESRLRVCADAFDLVITDFRMPGLTGLDVIGWMRKNGCNTPVIVVSALPPEMVQKHANDVNAFYLSKPVALDNLRRIANNLVARHPTEEGDGL